MEYIKRKCLSDKLKLIALGFFISVFVIACYTVYSFAWWHDEETKVGDPVTVTTESIDGNIKTITKTTTTTYSGTHYNTSSYDIWRYSDGETWQNNISPGAMVYNVKSSFNTGIRETATKQITDFKVEFMHFSSVQDVTNSEMNRYPSTGDDPSCIVGSCNIHSATHSSDGKVSLYYDPHLNTIGNGINGHDITQYDWQGKLVRGYRYFIPMKVTWTAVETIVNTTTSTINPDGTTDATLNVSLGLPEAAGINEQYTVSDESVYSDPTEIATAILEKKTGSGDWVVVPSWKVGTTSITDSSAVPIVNQYRLTVTLKNGKSGTDTKTITVSEKKDVSGEAYLVTEPYTYVGHPTVATDKSNITVTDSTGTNTYSAASAYQLGLASNRFTVLNNISNSSTKISDIKRQYVFNQVGTANIELQVSTDTNDYYDTKSIEVRKTPDISASLGGTQKQNRKQTLSFSVATSPGYPVKDVWVELSDPATGEKVHLTPSSTVNSTNIKTRLMTSSGDQYFNNYTLDFLTKNTATKTYQYTIYAMDQKGDADTETNTFSVAPDLPPVAVIDLANEFIRNEGTNIATISANDATVSSDGDQVQRTWSIAFDTNNNGVADTAYSPISNYGLQDLSFGTLKNIKFMKTGVGYFNLKLDVKEVWIEPTLEEYVTDADHLTGTTNKNANVINVAPIISVDPLKTYPADVLLITTSKDYQTTVNKAVEIKANFLTQGIDSVVTIRQIDSLYPSPLGIDKIGGMDQSIGLPPGAANQYAWDWSGPVFAIDDNNTYWVRTSGIQHIGSYDYNIAPYKIEAQDNLTGAVKWTYTTTETNFTLANDNQDKYLYVICDTKTLLLDKKTGAYVTTLNFKAEGNIYLSDKYLYFFKRTGIDKYNLTTGAYTNVFYASNCNASTLVNGKVNFAYLSGNILYRGIYDMVNDTWTKQYVDTMQYEESWAVADIDSYGSILLSRSDNRELAGHDTNNRAIKVYDKYNTLIKDITDTGEYRSGEWWNWIKNESGKATHIFHAGDSHGTHDYQYVDFWEINGTRTGQIKDTYTQDNGHPPFIYGIDLSKSGYLYLLRAAYFDMDAIQRSYDVALDSNTFTEKGVTYCDAAREYAFSSNLYSIWGYFEEDNTLYDSTYGDFVTNQGFHRYRINQTLEDSLERIVSKYGYFRNGAQKYVVVMDDVYSADTTDMTDLKARFLREGINFIFVGDNLTSNSGDYGNLIKSAVNETAIEYDNTSISNNLKAISNKVAELKKNVCNLLNVVGNAAGNTNISKVLQLDPDTTYEYDYDIRYNSDNAKNTLDIANVVNSITNNGYYNSTTATAKVTNEYYEDFNDSILDSFFTFSGNWHVGRGYNGIANGTSSLITAGAHTSYSENITFTVSRPSKLSFKYRVDTINYPDWDPEYFVIKLNGNQIVNTNSTSWQEYSGYLTTGTYTISMGYIFDGSYPELGPYFDDLKVETLEFGSSLSNTGTFSKQTETVVKDQWYSVSNQFITPPDTVRYSQLEEKLNYTEDFSDAVVDSHFTIMGDCYINSGQCVTNYNKLYKNIYITVNIPSGYTATLQFDMDYASTYSSHYGYCYDGNGVQIGGVKNSDGIKTFVIQSVVNGQVINLKSNYYAYDWMFLDNLKITAISNNTGLPVIYDTNGKGYVQTSTYNRNSTFSLGFNSANAFNFDVKDFHLYKIVNGVRKLVDQEDFISQTDFASHWTTTASNATATVKTSEPIVVDEDAPLVYKKGQLVLYNIFYDDFEGDPSKIGYWKYTHTPWNDGLNPISGQTLTEPVDRFYIDGKYVVQHWEYDNTGTTSYDKQSNLETIIFYVSGEPSGYAPYVKTINTYPTTVTEGNPFAIKTTVDDDDNDTLDVIVDVYKKGKWLYSYEKSGVYQIDGDYPTITTAWASLSAAAGTYTAVVTVSDHDGVGVDYYKFNVESLGSITGAVNHTTEWNQNRINYNMKHSGTQNSPRAYNVFWSGEKFMLSSVTEGKPTSVCVQILGTSYSTYLNSSDLDNWDGSLWEESMINKWGRTSPVTLTFRFTAKYSNGKTLTDDVNIIIDSQDDYWVLHRLF